MGQKYLGVLLIWGLLANMSALAQDVRLLVSNDPVHEGHTINIKWISDQILFDKGVNLYRRPEGKETWKKLNAKPILPNYYTVPPEAFEQDSTLSEYVELATGITAADLQGMTKAFIILKAVYSNEFSKYIGIQWDDNTVQPDQSYRYMLKKVTTAGDELLAFSEVILAGEFIPEKPIEDVQVKAKNTKAHFKWKVDNERFHSVNIYRSTGDAPQLIRQNNVPIVLSQRVGPNGKMEYPKHYFTQTKLKDGVDYTYRLAGIDFFGRETEFTPPLSITSRDTIPPPSPKSLICKVKLLEVDLEWTPVSSPETVGINIYRKRSIYDTLEKINDEMLSPLATRYHDVLEVPGNYYYQVASIDKWGNRGYSNLEMAQSLDIYPPETPQGLTAVADTGQITLRWKAVLADDLMGYRLYRTIDADNTAKYNLMNSETLSDTVFTDKLPFNARNKFYYVVVAVDSSYNMSSFSVPTKATLPDIAPPEKPFIKKVEPVEGQALEITWGKNFDIDLLGYNLFRDKMGGDSVAQTQRLNPGTFPPDKTSYLDLDIEKGVLYHYYLQAMDSVGNLSELSERYPAMIAKPQVETVEGLKNLSVKYNEKTREVQITWQPVGRTLPKGVVIFRGNSPDAPMNPVSGLVKANTYSEENPVTETVTFYYKVVAYYPSGKKWESEIYPLQLENK